MAAPRAVRWRHRAAPGGAAQGEEPMMAAPGGGTLRTVVEGGARGLVLVRDSASCEGRSLLRAFATAAVKRAEPVLVVLLDVPREQFEAGLSPEVKQRLHYHDSLWTPPLRCPMDVGGLLEAIAGGGRGGGPHGARGLPELAPAAPPPPPPGPDHCGAAAGGARGWPLGGAVAPGPAPPRRAKGIGGRCQRPTRGGGRPPPPAPQNPPSGAPPPQARPCPHATPAGGGSPIGLSEAERAARAAVPPPYELSSNHSHHYPPHTGAQFKGSPPIDPDPPEDEDPDEDLDV
ncbi:uncharacterized protein PRD47_018875 [Ara ararauna]